MKKLLIVIGVLVVIGLATPFFIGNKAEEQFRNIYSDINVGEDITFEVIEYNKGWFDSTATVAVNVRKDILAQNSETIVASYLKHNIQHGPVLTQTKEMGFGILDVDMQVEVPEEINKDLPELKDILNEVISFASRIHMDGSALTVMNIHGYEFAQDGAEFNINPGEFEVSIGKEQSLKVFGEWAGMSMKANSQDLLHLGSTAVEVDVNSLDEQELVLSGLFTGSTSLKMSEVEVSSSPPLGGIKLTDIAMASDNGIIEEHMTVNMNMSVGTLNIAGLVLSDFVFDQEINSINVPALKKVNQLANLVNTGYGAGIEPLHEAVFDLMDYQPVMRIKQLAVTTPQGRVNTNAKIHIDKDSIDRNNPQSIVLAIAIDAAGSVPVAFAEAMGLMPLIEPYLTKGYLEIESDEIRFDMVYGGGQILMFGKPLESKIF